MQQLEYKPCFLWNKTIRQIYLQNRNHQVLHAITFSFSNKSDKTRLFPNNFCFRKHSSNKYISFCQYFIPQGIGTKFILYLGFERPYHATCQLIDFMSPKNILVPIITGMEYNIHILFPFDFITNLQYLYKLGVSIKQKRLQILGILNIPN